MDTGSSNSATMLERRGEPAGGLGFAARSFPCRPPKKAGPSSLHCTPSNAHRAKFFNLEVQNHEEDCEERMDCGRQRGQGPG